MKKRVFAILFAVVWLLFITLLLCTPGTRLPKIDWQNKILLDKWAHVFLFLVLVVLWCRVYLNQGSKPGLKNTFITITILTVLYGIAMEVVQHFFIPLRSFDLVDMIANGIGSMAGYFISVNRFLKKRLEK